MSQTAITEADLHAYLDGQLPEARRPSIETYLGTYPEEAARLRDYQAQSRTLRELFNPVLDEPLPDALRQRATQPMAQGVHPTVVPTSGGVLSRWSLQRIAAGFSGNLGRGYSLVPLRGAAVFAAVPIIGLFLHAVGITVSLLIFSKHMTTDSRLVRYVCRIIAGECGHGAVNGRQEPLFSGYESAVLISGCSGLR